jgi:hypothetical protein
MKHPAKPLPLIKPGQVIPASGGLVAYKDGNGKRKLLRVICIPKSLP